MENIDSATLVTEYAALSDQAKEIATRKDAIADEIKSRLRAGLVVQNAVITATLQERAKRTYNVMKALTAIRKFKLNAALLLNVVAAEVKKLPAEVQAELPYVEVPTEALTLKPRK